MFDTRVEKNTKSEIRHHDKIRILKQERPWHNFERIPIKLEMNQLFAVF